MNKIKKNIVIVGFTENEKQSISIPALSEPYYKSQKIHYVNSLSQATNYQGYMLIIDNKDNKTFVELDKKYRHLFNKFERVIIYNKSYDTDYFETYDNKWFKVEKIGSSLFEDLSYNLGEEWDEYKDNKYQEKKKTIKFNKDKEERLNILYEYIKKYKTRKTIDIMKDLNMNARSIQRYMQDLNSIYHNIGYDYSLNEWYFS